MFGLAFGLTAGFVFGLGRGIAAGLVAGLVFGFIGGGMLGGMIGRTIGRAKAPARGMRINAIQLMVGLAFGLAFGLMAGLASGLAFGLAFGLGAGLACGVGLGLGLTDVPSDLIAAASPQAVLARDRQVALLRALATWLVLGLVFVFVFGIEATTFELGVGLAGGLGFGLVSGLFLSMYQTAWPLYLLARGWLAFRHRLPWPLMSFLADAHQRGVLRQSGAVYQFRHIELQHRLATRPLGPQPEPAKTGESPEAHDSVT